MEQDAGENSSQMSNVIAFGKRPKPTYPGSDEPTPKFVLEIYERPDGFDWHVLADDPISEDKLSDFLGDMFFTLNPDVVPEPGIFRRAATFIRNLFHGGGK